MKKTYRRKEYFVTTPKVSGEVKLVLLSDLHGKVHGKNNEELLADIAGENPDFVAVAGDMMVATVNRLEESRKHTLDFLKRLVEICPVYYGMGNHEMKIDMKEKLAPFREKYVFEYLEEMGVKFLDDETETIDVKGSEIAVTGVSIQPWFYKKIGRLHMAEEYLDTVLEGQKADHYQILIAHNPHYFETYAKWGADLSLSGHLHGGVVGWPNCGGVISPQFKLFPKYCAGKFEKDGKTLIVSRGLGDHKIPVRIFNPREYVVIHICPENKI